MKIANADGERTVSMDDWALAYMTPNISPEDVLVDITFRFGDKPRGMPSRNLLDVTVILPSRQSAP